MLPDSRIKKKLPRHEKRKRIVNKFSQKSPADEYAYAVYVLHKETAISYTDIFGEEVVVTETIEESRGPIKDILYGKKKVERKEVVRTPGMRAQTLQTYLDLMEEHSERVEKERKRGKMKDAMKGKMGGI